MMPFYLQGDEMPSFDIVSKTDTQEVDNAVNQVKKEIATRYDFKGSNSTISWSEPLITIIGDSENKVNTVAEMLRGKFSRRKLDVRCLEYGRIEDASGGCKRQVITVRQGLDTDLARSIVKKIKQSKMKVQGSIQGDSVRVSGKKRDDLQAVMSLVRGMAVDLPLQFTNFRD